MKRIVNILCILVYGTVPLGAIEEGATIRTETTETKEETLAGPISTVEEDGTFKGEPTAVAVEEPDPSSPPSLSASLIRSNPFIPFNFKVQPEKETQVVSTNSELIFSGYLKLQGDRWAFSLKDKSDPKKSFWLDSFSIDPNQSYIFRDFNEGNRILTLENRSTGEYFSLYLEKQKTSNSGGPSLFSDFGGSGPLDDDFGDLDDSALSED